MQTYIKVNEMIKFTDNNGVIHWIPQDELNTDFQIFLNHKETAADKTAQSKHDAEQISKNNAEQAEAEAKAVARQALLDRLGITADEAQLLLGSN
jgi:hypothetical protein